MDVNTTIAIAAQHHPITTTRISPLALWKACDGDSYRALDAAIAVTRARRDATRTRTRTQASAA